MQPNFGTVVITLCVLGIIFSCAIIWQASNGFEAASGFLGRNLSDGVRGATINAIGSSMPEFFTTLFFLLILRDGEGFGSGLATTAGSAIFNGIVIPAFVILVVILANRTGSVGISRKTIRRDGIALLLAECVLFVMLLGGTLYWYHGLILVSCYALYVGFMLKNMHSKEEIITEEDYASDEKQKAGIRELLLLDLERIIKGNQAWTKRMGWTVLIAAVAVIGSASALLVKSCEALGEELGISVYFIAVILAAAATSIPDTFLSVRDAQKGNYDDAVSNALGSNVFDLCFALGFPLFLYTLFVQPISLDVATSNDTLQLMLVLILLTLITYWMYRFSKRLRLIHAITLFGLYLSFVLFISATALEAAWLQPILFRMNEFFSHLRYTAFIVPTFV